MRAVRVSGLLDTSSATRPEVLLVLKNGASVPVRRASAAPDLLRHLVGKAMMVSGVARFDASGRLEVIGAEYLGLAREKDALWGRVPAPMSDRGAPVVTAQRQG